METSNRTRPSWASGSISSAKETSTSKPTAGGTDANKTDTKNKLEITADPDFFRSMKRAPPRAVDESTV